MSTALPESVRLLDAREVMVEAIKHELEDVLGCSPSEAIDFNVHPDLGSVSPLEYEAKLREMLGDGADVLLLGMRNRMCGLAGEAPKATCIGISGCLQCLVKAHSKSSIYVKIGPPSPTTL
jgi:hypothetical protein